MNLCRIFIGRQGEVGAVVVVLYGVFGPDSAVGDPVWAIPGASLERRRHPSAQFQSRCCNLASYRARFETARPCTGHGRRLGGTNLLSSPRKGRPGSSGNFLLRNSGSEALSDSRAMALNVLAAG
jgi:hypothetical protein